MLQNKIPPGSEDGQRETRNARSIFLAFLVMLVMLSTGIVSFLLGKNTAPAPVGQIIDTILLTPDAPTEGDKDISIQDTFHFIGHVIYTDGTPVAGRTLELHSDPVRTVSDSGGGFLFANVSEGDHRVILLNDDETPAMERRIHVTRNPQLGDLSLKLTEDGEYVLELSANIRALELVMEISVSELTLNTDYISYATWDGLVVTPGGSASIRDGVVVSPEGTVYLPDRTIVLPGAAAEDATYIITREEQVLVNQPMTGEGISVSPEGIVTLPAGIMIAPGVKIETPDGAFIEPGTSGMLIAAGSVVPIGAERTGNTEDRMENVDLPVQTTPEPSTKDIEAEQPQESGETAETEDSLENAETKPAETAGSQTRPEKDDSGSGDDSSSRPTSAPEPTAPEVPTLPTETPAETVEPTTPEDGKGGLLAKETMADGSLISWTQLATIDLFRNRASGIADKIAPGSSGYYLFRLENTREEDLIISLAISATEDSLSLPLKFDLRPDNKDGGAASGTMKNGRGLTLETKLEGNESRVYRLDWKWPFDGNDSIDTAAGIKAGEYKVKITIYAEGVLD